MNCDDISGSVNAGGDVQISKAIVHMKNKLKNDISSEISEVVK